MPRFFDDVSGDGIILKGENATHIIKSLRMSVGESLIVCSDGTDYECQIVKIGGNEVACRVISSFKNETEPSVLVTVYQGLPKGDKLEMVIQKAVELGADKIVPVLCERSVPRPDKKAAEKKNERYNKISLEACKQSGRGKQVLVMPMISFKDAVGEISKYDTAVLFYEGGGQPLNKILTKNSRNICIFIGPEGGFDSVEVEQALQSGAVAATLGKRILRTETAPIAALSAIMYATGNME